MSHIVSISRKYVTTNKKYPKFNCLNRAKKNLVSDPNILWPTQFFFEVLWNIQDYFYTFQRIFILFTISF